VSPRLLVGLETNYGAEDLRNYGVDLSIPDYVDVDFASLLHHNTNPVFALTSMIKKFHTLRDIKQVLLDDGKLKGGFIADVVQFKVVTSDKRSHSYVLKYENEQVNGLSTMAKQLGLYEREYYFYKVISPEVPIRMPTFINTVKRNDGKTCGILLENLLDAGFTVNLNLNEHSIDLTLKIVDRMAKMHAHFWGKPLGDLFPELKTSLDNAFAPFFSDFIAERYDAFKNIWFKILNPRQQSRCDDIASSFGEIQSRFSVGHHLTFIHGDIKSPNIFYDADNDCEPYFIDWQHCAVGKGVQDLVFLVLESFDILQLPTVFPLVKLYYYKKLLEEGVLNYSMEEYDRDIYDAICYVPFFTSVWFGTIPQDELIDKNFPYFLISKLFYLLEQYYPMH
jgi:hypothetical protein